MVDISVYVCLLHYVVLLRLCSLQRGRGSPTKEHNVNVYIPSSFSLKEIPIVSLLFKGNSEESALENSGRC